MAWFKVNENSGELIFKRGLSQTQSQGSTCRLKEIRHGEIWWLWVGWFIHFHFNFSVDLSAFRYDKSAGKNAP